MTTTITMSFEEYSLLLDHAFSRRTDATELKDLQKRIDRENSVKRYLLNIRWYEIGGAPPTRIEIKNNNGWPPTQTAVLKQDRPIAREDVDTFLLGNAKNPVGVTLTKDENGIVGWTELDVWDFNLNV